MLTMETFTNAGVDFMFAMSGCALCDWKTARGAAWYFNGDNGVGVFMRGLKNGKLLAHETLAAYGTNAYEVHSIKMQAL